MAWGQTHAEAAGCCGGEGDGKGIWGISCVASEWVGVEGFLEEGLRPPTRAPTPSWSSCLLPESGAMSLLP